MVRIELQAQNRRWPKASGRWARSNGAIYPVKMQDANQLPPALPGRRSRIAVAGTNSEVALYCCTDCTRLFEAGVALRIRHRCIAVEGRSTG